MLQPEGTKAVEALSLGGSGPTPQAAESTPPMTQWELAIMSICNNATVTKDTDGSWKGLGDQTEVALKVLAAGAGLTWPEKRLTRVSEIAFDSDRKRMSVICEVQPGTETVPGLPPAGTKVCYHSGSLLMILSLG
jgi:magnesium-transporting ATPase (P-type)